MKKTVALIIAFCLVVLVCVPSIPSRASSGYMIYFKSNESVDGFFSDAEYNKYQRNITGCSASVVKDFYGALPIQSYTYNNNSENFNLNEWDFYLFFEGDGNSHNLYCYVMKFQADAHVMIACLNQNTDFSNNYTIGKNYRVFSPASVQTERLLLQYSNGAWFRQGSLVLNNLDGFMALDFNSINLLASNGYCMCRYDVVNVHGYNYYLGIGYEHYEEFTNFISGDLPYTNSEGSTSDPTVDPEVNTALAFDVFNSQVVYNQLNKTFTSANVSWDLNPMGRAILEAYPANEWEMKFTCQVTYNMSSYRPNNQTTPLQSYANGFTFTGTYAFEDYDSIMDGQIYGIDPIKGFETLSDTEIASAVNPDCNLFFALLGAMKGDYASGNSYTSGKSGFALAGGTIKRAWNGLVTAVGGFGHAITQLQGLTGVDGRDWLEDHVSGDYIYMVDNFTMNVRAWFECGSVKSNYGDTDIDYLNHTTSSYAPRAYETQEGVDPTIPDPYTNTNDTPVEPGGLDANGVIVYVPVNVEVNVPSGGGDNTVTSGDNSIINNNNPTFNPVFNNNNENSVESLSDLIGEDAATANNGIGGFLDPFKNNSMVTLTGEYFGIVPEGLRTVLTAAVGILIILGIYRFIRRG